MASGLLRRRPKRQSADPLQCAGKRKFLSAFAEITEQVKWHHGPDSFHMDMHKLVGVLHHAVFLLASVTDGEDDSLR